MFKKLKKFNLTEHTAAVQDSLKEAERDSLKKAIDAALALEKVLILKELEKDFKEKDKDIYYYFSD